MHTSRPSCIVMERLGNCVTVTSAACTLLNGVFDMFIYIFIPLIHFVLFTIVLLQPFLYFFTFKKYCSARRCGAAGRWHHSTATAFSSADKRRFVKNCAFISRHADERDFNVVNNIVFIRKHRPQLLRTSQTLDETQLTTPLYLRYIRKLHVQV